MGCRFQVLASTEKGFRVVEHAAKDLGYGVWRPRRRRAGRCASDSGEGEVTGCPQTDPWTLLVFPTPRARSPKPLKVQGEPMSSFETGQELAGPQGSNKRLRTRTQLFIGSVRNGSF